MKALKSLLIFVFLMLLISTVKAQAPSCNVYCKNVVQLSDTSIQFDVKILRSGTDPYNYVKGQYALSYNTAIRPGGNGGTWTLTLTNSDLPAPKQCVILGTSVSTNGVFVLWGPPDNISDYFISDVDTVLVARVIATLSVPFATAPLNLVWRTALPNPFTKLYYNNAGVSTIVPAANLTYSMIGGDITVPVELASFNASANERNVNLTWETKSELNSSLFEIERASLSASPVQDWKAIGSVQASGTSTTAREYSFMDHKLNSGKYNYRLKMVDNDGTFKYSDVIEVEIALPKEYSLSQNYPNPFNPSTRIDYQLPFDSKVMLELYAITGEKAATIMNTEQSAGYYTMDINAGQFNLASGVYIYRMTANNQSGQNFVQVKKLMLTK